MKCTLMWKIDVVIVHNAMRYEYKYINDSLNVIALERNRMRDSLTENNTKNKRINVSLYENTIHNVHLR